MSVQLSPILQMHGDRLAFLCPGCDKMHTIRVNCADGWQWDGCVNHPTIQPSILVNPGRENPNTPVCHSYIRDGNIQFLSDCSHKLAGLTVPMTTFESDLG
jgi:hypothetical protein